MAENTTVTVSLGDNDDAVTGVTFEVVYDDDGTEKSGYEPIVIEAGATGTSTSTIKIADDVEYHHPRDKNVTITGTSGDYTEGTVMLSVREDDSPVGALSLSASPPSLSVGGGGSTELTASIAAKPGDDDEGDPITVPVTVTTEHSVENALGGGGSANLTAIATDEQSTTNTLSGVTVTAEGTVTVTASAMNYTPAKLEINIISRTARDLEGFRVTMLPADGAWVGFGKKKVKVEVTRVNNYANDWERFSSIKVALHDTLAVTGLIDGEIYSLTASGFNNVDGEIEFSSAASNDRAFPGKQ